MKKTSALVAIILCTLGLFAQTNRVYIQQVVLGNGLDILNLVTNSGETHCGAFSVMAVLMTNPGEIITTDDTTPANLRICRMGNGETVPYYAVVYVQLGAFPSGWVVGATLHIQITYTATGEQADWDYTLPAGNTPIVILEPTQTIPPADQFRLSIQGYIISIFPVSGVTVHCSGIGDVITDETGSYYFEVQGWTHYDVTASKPGFTMNASFGYDTSQYCYWNRNFYMKDAHPVGAEYPVPANGVSNVNFNAPILSWSYRHDIDHTDPTCYKVYFPADATEYAVVNQTSSDDYTYYLGIPWEPETTYTWKVVPCYVDDENSYDALSVPVWTFTTAQETGTDEQISTDTDRMITAYPNPARQSDNITFEIKSGTETHGTLVIYNLKGQQVKAYQINKGSHVYTWDGTDENNHMISVGVYIYKLSTNTVNMTRKMVILR